MKRAVRIPQPILVMALTALISSSEARADLCGVSDAMPASSPDGRFRVSAEWQEAPDRWVYVWEDADTGKTVRKRLNGFAEHAHLALFIAADGKRFAALDVSAGHRLDARLLIFEADGRVRRRFGLRDFVHDDTVRAARKSMAHLEWLHDEAFHPGGAKLGFDPIKDMILVTSANGAVARVSLRTLKVTVAQ